MGAVSYGAKLPPPEAEPCAPTAEQNSRVALTCMGALYRAPPPIYPRAQSGAHWLRAPCSLGRGGHTRTHCRCSATHTWVTHPLGDKNQNIRGHQGPGADLVRDMATNTSTWLAPCHGTLCPDTAGREHSAALAIWRTVRTPHALRMAQNGLNGAAGARGSNHFTATQTTVYTRAQKQSEGMGSGGGCATGRVEGWGGGAGGVALR